MDKNLHDYRKSYEKGSLTEDTVLENPLEQFAAWFEDAEKTPTVEEPNAMTLSTVDTQGVPKARVVLLKEFTQEGFVFYTNYTSGKAQAIAQNNKVCISFFLALIGASNYNNGYGCKNFRRKIYRLF